jgi:hypothetical protein
MKIINEKGEINFNSAWRRWKTPMVSSNGVANVFGASACIAQAYSFT